MRDRGEYLPTRRQIRQACVAIRSRWTPAERRRRTVGAHLVGPAPWSPPCIETAHCLARVRHIADASA
ncbi:MAG TPA: hypothetical protein VEQ85_10880 [Lacipirellulaceae bacterium]|nr:hypothetical protein [Lacipirellulaceae bacterium]